MKVVYILTVIFMFFLKPYVYGGIPAIKDANYWSALLYFSSVSLVFSLIFKCNMPIPHGTAKPGEPMWYLGGLLGFLGAVAYLLGVYQL